MLGAKKWRDLEKIRTRARMLAMTNPASPVPMTSLFDDEGSEAEEVVGRRYIQHSAAAREAAKTRRQRHANIRKWRRARFNPRGKKVYG